MKKLLTPALIFVYTLLNFQVHAQLPAVVKDWAKIAGNQPNASNNFLTNQTSQDARDKLFISIKNLLGENIITKKIINKDLESIDVSNFAPGVYLIQVFSQNEFENLKFIKE